MNRAALQELIRQHLGGTATPMAAQLALDAVLRSIRDGLQETGEVRLAKFGTFRVQKRAARRLLLPGSGTPMQLPRRKVITFKGLCHPE